MDFMEDLIKKTNKQRKSKESQKKKKKIL